MDQGGREKGRGLAKWVNAYGWPCSRPLTYQTYVQLHLNISRVEYRQSNTIGRGVGIAHSMQDLEYEWADALAECSEEADQILFEANAARQQARIRARLGFDR